MKDWNKTETTRQVEVGTIEKHGHHAHIYMPCEICGALRWVVLSNYAKGDQRICQSCAVRSHKGLLSQPGVLAVGKASGLGWKNTRALAVKDICPRCQEERWRLAQEYRRNPQALCRKCQNEEKIENGRHYTKDGYVIVPIPLNHPYVKRTEGRQRILEHRLVMSEMLQRELKAREQVHHKNGVKDDNREANLELIQPADHTLETEKCRDCELRNEVRLLRWQQTELMKVITNMAQTINDMAQRLSL